ncbi:MAG: MFS transporter [Gammaproteobacteria bacterium]|nr:MAG: MFS transporter [Gammaproteobacteria bacterium]
MPQRIQVEQLVDEQRIDRFNINLLLWSFLAMFCDGYDISALSYAAPELVRLWDLEAQAMKWPLSASPFGILFGAPLLGFFGDRYGRKRAIIAGCVIYGLCTLAIVWAENLQQILVLRFLTGIGIGGLMPNTISLNSELSPKRWRATLTVLMFTGITLGSASPGAIATTLAPEFGWQAYFVIGGIVPLMIAAALVLFLPESVKYLVQRPERRGELLRTARWLRRDLAIADDTEFTLTPTPHFGGTGLRDAFSGGLALITPLLWVCFCSALMVNFFLGSWMPILFESIGLVGEKAALITSIYHIGGAAGGVLISLLLDRFGFLVVFFLLLLGIPAVAVLGAADYSWLALSAIATTAGIAVLGAQFGNNAAAGLLYPTAFRSKAVGFAFAVGRLGAVTGPLIGGVLIGMKLPINQLFMIGAIPLIIGAIAAAILARVCYQRFRGFQLDDAPATPAPTSGSIP